jgi:membrane associated rhomboid family serine protease
VGLVFQSILSSAIRYRQWTEHAEIVIPYLTFVPQLSIVYPWTLLTTSLVESNIFTLAVGAATLYYGGRYLERAWSSRELAKFVALVTLVPNFLTFGMLVILFTLSRNESWTYAITPDPLHCAPANERLCCRLTVVSGTISIQISFLVAFSQLVPAHTVTLFRGVLSLRVPRFPLVHLGVVTLLSLTPILSIASFWLALFGFLTSWTYLRFYKTVFPDLEASSQSAGLRGDASETFAFAEFFPAPAKPYVAAFADQIFEAFVAMRVCTPFSQADMSAARGESYLQRGTPGSARAEAERRRAIALRALDQRLHAATGNAPSRSPSQQAAQMSSGQSDDQQSQHQTNTQTATTSQPGQMLGETKFEPDHDDDEHKH